MVVPGQQLYDFAGTHAAVAVLAALRARPRGRRPADRHVGARGADRSCFDIYSYTNSALIGRRRPRATRYSSGDGIWLCRDGAIEFVASTDKHWFALVELLGRPAELSDPAWAHPGVRQPHDRQDRRDHAAARSAVLSREDFVTRGQQLGLPCALVNTVGQFVVDPQPRSRDFFVPGQLAGSGESELPGPPFRCTERVLDQYRRPAPRLGAEDARAVARAWRARARSGRRRVR